MVDYYKDRLTGILAALKGACRTDRRPVTGVVRKDIGYYQRETVLEETDGWQPFGRFDTWGGRETHTCFRAKVTVPQEWEGKTVAVTLQTGVTDIWNTDNPQFLVYLDGRLVCGHDMNHNEVILTENAVAGQVFDYGLYAYSNSAGRDVFLMLDAAVVQKEVEELYYDMKVPFEIASLLKKDDMQRQAYFLLLNDVVNRLDLREIGSEVFYESVRLADNFLKEELYTEKEKNAPVTVHSVGHTHIDVAWKWPLRQTREKVLRSFATVLYEMERYPEYKFMSSQPQLYQFVKEEEPELFEKIKARVAEGRWETEGAMWLEADCNLSSGESLIRQILYGKRFFKEEFGKGDNVVLWLPDVFGYSAAMPQILKKSGIRYFMTTKIGWNEYNRIPNDTMLWQGIDGTEILTYFITTRDYVTDPELYTRSMTETTYNGRQNANQIMGTWQRYQNKEINNELLTCFGHGDGGGGATIQMLEESRRMEYALPSCPKVKQTFVREFFEGLEERLAGKKVPKWCGELYLEFHRGTYTSMARNKKYNRRAEFKNQDAESFGVFAKLEGADYDYPRDVLRHVWELTLLNQFHDILPGSSIKDVYEDSKAQYEEIFALDDKMIQEALAALQGERRADTFGNATEAVFENTLEDAAGKSAENVIEDAAENTAEDMAGNAAENAVENMAGDAAENTDDMCVTLYNNTSFVRADSVESEGILMLYDGDEPLPCQYTESQTTVWQPKPIPARGYRTFRIKRTSETVDGIRTEAAKNNVETGKDSAEAGRSGIGTGKYSVATGKDSAEACRSSIGTGRNRIETTANYDSGVNFAGEWRGTKGTTGGCIVDMNRRTLRTPFYDVAFNEAWEIVSLYDKRVERELAAILVQASQQQDRKILPLNALIAFEDRPKEYNCWNIDPYYEEKSWNIREVRDARCVENGPVRAVLRVTKKFCHSVIVQDMVFYTQSPRIDFKTKIDWNESQILLKAAFPLDIMAPKATYEIQYGNVERPTHTNTSWEQAKFEVCAHKWADLSEAGYGVALLNDCKYGYDIHGNVMRLTLLKSGVFPNTEADREHHEFTYSLWPHEGDFRAGHVIKEAYLLNCPVYEVRGEGMPEEKSYFSTSVENVVIETVKLAEDGDDIIVRLYEAFGMRTKASLCIAGRLEAAYECNMMEHAGQKAELIYSTKSGRSQEESILRFEIRPYEIKTYRLVQE